VRQRVKKHKSQLDKALTHGGLYAVKKSMQKTFRDGGGGQAEIRALYIL
jgi:hypothetical protein